MECTLLHFLDFLVFNIKIYITGRCCELDPRSFELFVSERSRQHDVDVWRFYYLPSYITIELPVSPDLLSIITGHCKRCERARKEQRLFSSRLRPSVFKIVVRPRYKANINSHNIFARYFMNVSRRPLKSDR